MATLKTLLRLLAFTDTTSSNKPDEVLRDLEREFIDETIDESDSKLVDIAASASDELISFDITNIKYLFLHNRSTTLSLKFKINGIGNTEFFLGPDGVLFLKSSNDAGVGQITQLNVSNADSSTAVKLEVFAAK